MYSNTDQYTVIIRFPSLRYPTVFLHPPLCLAWALPLQQARPRDARVPRGRRAAVQLVSALAVLAADLELQIRGRSNAVVEFLSVLHGLLDLGTLGFSGFLSFSGVLGGVLGGFLGGGGCTCSFRRKGKSFFIGSSHDPFRR